MLFRKIGFFVLFCNALCFAAPVDDLKRDIVSGIESLNNFMANNTLKALPVLSSSALSIYPGNFGLNPFFNVGFRLPIQATFVPYNDSEKQGVLKNNFLQSFVNTFALNESTVFEGDLFPFFQGMFDIHMKLGDFLAFPILQNLDVGFKMGQVFSFIDFTRIDTQKANLLVSANVFGGSIRYNFFKSFIFNVGFAYSYNAVLGSQTQTYDISNPLYKIADRNNSFKALITEDFAYHSTDLNLLGEIDFSFFKFFVGYSVVFELLREYKNRQNSIEGTYIEGTTQTAFKTEISPFATPTSTTPVLGKLLTGVHLFGVQLLFEMTSDFVFGWSLLYDIAI